MSDERKALMLQFGKLRGSLICNCNMLMHTKNSGKENTAVCYNPKCQHYKITFTVEYPQVMLVQYEDTEPITKL